MLDTPFIETLLDALGQVLSAEGGAECIVVVGGTSLALQGYVTRTTDDVDVIATALPETQPLLLVPPDPISPALSSAIATVARDFRLAEDWMNTEIALQWTQGLPPGLIDDITWRRYHALYVGLVGRRTLITLKLFAAVDRGPRSVHFQDLVSLQPTREELNRSAEWVRTQDSAPEFSSLVDDVIQHVLDRIHP